MPIVELAGRELAVAAVAAEIVAGIPHLQPGVVSTDSAGGRPPVRMWSVAEVEVEPEPGGENSRTEKLRSLELELVPGRHRKVPFGLVEVRSGGKPCFPEGTGNFAKLSAGELGSRGCAERAQKPGKAREKAQEMDDTGLEKIRWLDSGKRPLEEGADYIVAAESEVARTGYLVHRDQSAAW